MVDDEVGREEEEASVVGPALLLRGGVRLGLRLRLRRRRRLRLRLRLRLRIRLRIRLGLGLRFRSAPRSIMMRWLASGSSRERSTTSEMMRSTYKDVDVCVCVCVCV